jgi:hypothetical protein
MTAKTSDISGTATSSERSAPVSLDQRQKSPESLSGWAAFGRGWNIFWSAFASLNWYDAFIEFLFRFTAKTSEPLLAIGIIYSAAIILSEGALTTHDAFFDAFWAITQAIAIESSGGVVLVYGLQSWRSRDSVKAVLYLVLSALLAIAGGIMLFMHLADWERPRDDPFMLALFTLRCVVSVGYIYLCRTKHIRFNDLKYAPENEVVGAPQQVQIASTVQPALPAPALEIDYERLAEALLPRLRPMLLSQATTVTESPDAVYPVPALNTPPARRENEKREAAQEQPQVQARTQDQVQVSPVVVPVAQPVTEELSAPVAQQPEAEELSKEEALKEELSKEEANQDRHLRLEQGYQALLAESAGKRVSGRALAERTHVSRAACTGWLKLNHSENEEQVPRRTDEIRQRVVKTIPEWAQDDGRDIWSGDDGHDMDEEEANPVVIEAGLIREAHTEEISLVRLSEAG